MKECKGLLVFVGSVILLCFFEGGCVALQTRESRPPHLSKEAGIYHEVQRGETLYRIATFYGVDVQSLIQANRLPDPSKLGVGQLLYIPGRVKIVSSESGPGDSRNQTPGPKGHQSR